MKVKEDRNENMYDVKMEPVSRRVTGNVNFQKQPDRKYSYIKLKTDYDQLQNINKMPKDQAKYYYDFKK